EVALEPHGAREAEGAPEAATDLGRYAEGEALAVGHEHRLDTGPIGEAEDELLAAVLRRRPSLDRRHLDRCAFRERLPELAREVSHAGEIRHSLAVDPVGDLAPAIARRAQRLDQGLDFGGQQIEKICQRHTHGRIAHETGWGPPRPPPSLIHRTCEWPVDNPVHFSRGAQEFQPLRSSRPSTRQTGRRVYGSAASWRSIGATSNARGTRKTGRTKPARHVMGDGSSRPRRRLRDAHPARRVEGRNPAPP